MSFATLTIFWKEMLEIFNIEGMSDSQKKLLTNVSNYIGKDLESASPAFLEKTFKIYKEVLGLVSFYD